MRQYSTWAWQTEPDAPLSWPDPEKRIVLCELGIFNTGAVASNKASWAISDAIKRGVAAVIPGSGEQLEGVGWLAVSADPPNEFIPALIVRRQADLAGVGALRRVHSEHKALLIEPEEPIDLDPLACPDCGGLDLMRADDGTPYCTECDGMGGIYPCLGGFTPLYSEMRRGSILNPRNEGVDLVIVRGREKPLFPAWVRSIRDRCTAAGVALYFAGWGRFLSARLGHLPEPGPMLLVEIASSYYFDVGPERSGRMLDGREWLEVPEGL